MRLGVLSDTHDNLPKIKSAVHLFNQRKVQMVIHAGDYVAPFSLAPLEQLRCRYIGVFGNNDGERKGLYKRSKRAIKEPPLNLNINKRRILILHDLNTLNKRMKRDEYDLIIFGHTHKVEVKKEAFRLILNPGECGGWLSDESTVAIVELKRMSVEILKL